MVSTISSYQRDAHLQQVPNASLNSVDGSSWKICRQPERSALTRFCLCLDDLDALVDTTCSQDTALAFLLKLATQLPLVTATCDDDITTVDSSIVPLPLQSCSECAESSRNDSQNDQEDTGSCVSTGRRWCPCLRPQWRILCGREVHGH